MNELIIAGCQCSMCRKQKVMDDLAQKTKEITLAQVVQDLDKLVLDLVRNGRGADAKIVLEIADRYR